MNITKQKNEEVFGRFLSGNGDSDRMIGNKGQSVDAGLKFNSIEERKKHNEWMVTVVFFSTSRTYSRICVS